MDSVTSGEPAAPRSFAKSVSDAIDRIWMRLAADTVLIVGTASLTLLVLTSARQPIAPALLRSTLAVLVPMVTWRWGGKLGLLAVLIVETLAMSLGSLTGGTSRLWELAASIASMTLMVCWVRLKRRHFDEDHDTARRDPLTGLLNRQAWYEHLELEVSRASLRHQPFSVVLLDCDGFKPLNDRFGHLVGDQVLRKIASVLRNCVRAYDAVGRLGGDEFVIVLSEADLATAESIVERLRTGLKHGVEREYAGLGVSLGVAVFPQPPASAEDGLRHADEAMYAAKKQGPGETVFEVIGSEPATLTLLVPPKAAAE
ncbi:MAG TPA: GGDEF domain-containing protein [Planctomycetaceae bacterium]|nr:GGDEF domain-containing protein [Planctomycetaceae bacterium]